MTDLPCSAPPRGLCRFPLAGAVNVDAKDDLGSEWVTTIFRRFKAREVITTDICVIMITPGTSGGIFQQPSRDSMNRQPRPSAPLAFIAENPAQPLYC